MSFLLDPIESGIDSLLDPLTSSAAAATSADEVVPVETSTTDGGPDITSTARAAATSSDGPATSTPTDETPTTSSRSKTTASSSSSLESTTAKSTHATTTTSHDSTSLSLPTLSATTLSTSTTTSSSSSSSSNSPLAPSAPSQPTLSPAQAASANTSDSNAPSSSGFSTAGIVVAAIIAAALLISIIWLVVRFCPPVRKRIDAWYERRREERTWRDALDGASAEKGSLSSAGASISDPTRPFSFFALGKNPQLHGDNLNNRTRDTMHQRQSHVSPNSAGVETPTSARSNGHGLGLGRVSLLRNTSLLRKAGFDAPPPPSSHPLQIPLSIANANATTSTPTSHRISQPIRSLKPSISQIKRKPLPAHPPVTELEGHPHQRSALNDPPLDRGLMTGRNGYSGRGSSRDGPLPKLQIQIPGLAPGLVVVDRERVSQIGLAVSGSPAVRSAR